MKNLTRVTAFGLALLLMLSSVAHVSAASDDATYYGGTVATFKEAKKEVKGHLVTTDETNLLFRYGKNNSERVSIPYSSVIDMEYGQKSGRRVGAAIATAVLL